MATLENFEKLYLQESIADQTALKQKMDRAADVSGQASSTLKEKETATAPARQAVIEASRAPIPEAPPVPGLQPPPQAPPIEKNTADLMASIGTLLTSITGFGSRMNGIRMNKMLAGFLNGYREVRYQDAEMARRQWHDAFEHQLRSYDTQIKQRQAILEARGMTIEDKLRELKMFEAPYDDRLNRLQVEEQSLDKEIHRLEELIRLRDSMQNAKTRITQSDERMRFERDKFTREQAERERHNKSVEAKKQEVDKTISGLNQSLGRLQSNRAALQKELQEAQKHWGTAVTQQNLRDKIQNIDEVIGTVQSRVLQLQGVSTQLQYSEPGGITAEPIEEPAQ